jgi:excinuclease ABC subunit C
MSLTHRLFGMRSCNETITGERGRPCLEYDIKRCIAPCVRELCTEEEYRTAVGHTRLFLEGRNEELVAGLRERMSEAAADERFEQAGQLRDAIRTIETLQTRQQKMASAELGDRDAFGLKLGPAGAVVQIFQVRGGRVIERVELVSELGTAVDAGAGAAPKADSGECDVLQAALQQFYADRPAPPEIHLPVGFSDADTEMLEAWLSGAAGRRVRLMVPQRGEKRGLLELAARNAQVAYQARFNENEAAQYDALETLRSVLALPSVPRRLECFDISTIQGSETVASMVVCEDGRMKRSEYRKFRIRGTALGAGPAAIGEPGPDGAVDASNADSAASTIERSQPSAERAVFAAEPVIPSAERPAPSAQRPVPTPESRVPRRILDDFASMHEVVLRRYRKLLESGGAFPDLVLIDGGKGQLSAAYRALEELGLGSLVAIGIAKKEELLFTRDRDDAIALARESPALLLIQRIRDEAHRFAVTFHRQQRKTRDLRSELDLIEGIGPRRRKALLTAFGSLAGVRRAAREELVRVVGVKAADAVLSHFASGT